MLNKQKNTFWVYMLLCENGSYYTGYTNDMVKRYHSHVNGTGGCKYTRSFKPSKLAQCWQIASSKSLAMQLEKRIKQLSRVEKEALIKKPAVLSEDPRVRVVSHQKKIKIQCLK